MSDERKNCLACENRQDPALCSKTCNPYTYCPLVFVHEDDMIAGMVSLIFADARLVQEGSGEEAERKDRAICTLTAYMNGRLDQAIRMLKGGNGDS